jgi:hypothetical protein
MARERRLPSARSSASTSSKQAKDATETGEQQEKRSMDKDDISHTVVSSAGEETLKHDEHQQRFSSEAKDTRTFHQLVHDYGDDSK